jgi:hypothetical protein
MCMFAHGFPHISLVEQHVSRHEPSFWEISPRLPLAATQPLRVILLRQIMTTLLFGARSAGTLFAHTPKQVLALHAEDADRQA